MAEPSTSTLPTRRIGKTELHVPILGIGTGSFSGLYREVPEAEAINTIHYALDHGVTLVDTAPWYGAFVAEGYVGNALSTRERSDYILSTKVCLWSENGDAARGYTRDQVLWSLEGSFKRLQVDRIDILHIHDPVDEAYRTVVEETIPTVLELRRQGVTRAVSCGTGNWRILVDLAREGDFDCVMLAGRYTLLEQGALAAINNFRERGISVLSAGIYNSGILATGASGGKYDYRDAPADVVTRVRALEAVCQRHGVPLKAAAAQFVRAHPAITSIILGVESPEQVAENIAVFDVPISREFWQDLKEAKLIDERAPLPEG
jgi:D-threo-aldose 1-dehydrogenase